MEANNKQLDKFIIFSHGFGVRKDSRGMFTEIAEWLLDYNCIFFDYNQFQDENTTIASSLTDQSKKFSEVLSDFINKNPQAEISIITHSQGAIPVSLSAHGNIKRIVLLAPSISKDINKSIRHFSQYPGTHIDLEGESVLGRKDGSKTIVPKEFWQDRQRYEPIDLYNDLAQKYKMIIIFADQDEIVQNSIESISPEIKKIHINADHNFTGDARNELKKALLEIFTK